MSDDLERILRNSLDAVDRGRRWATLGVAALFFATLVMLIAAFLHAGSRDTGKFMFVVSAAEMLFVGCCTAALMFQITRTTKAILRAIEHTRRG